MFDFVFQIILEIIILPLALVVSTPVILVMGFFGKSSYVENIKSSYRKVINWWKKYI